MATVRSHGSPRGCKTSMRGLPAGSPCVSLKDGATESVRWWGWMVAALCVDSPVFGCDGAPMGRSSMWTTWKQGRGTRNPSLGSPGTGHHRRGERSGTVEVEREVAGQRCWEKGRRGGEGTGDVWRDWGGWLPFYRSRGVRERRFRERIRPTMCNTLIFIGI
jgi:hypothetical protein